MISNEIKISNETQQLLSADQAWFYHVVPLSLNNAVLELAIDETVDEISSKIELEMLLGKEVKFQSYPSAAITKALNKFYRKSQNESITFTVNDDYDEHFVSKLIAESREFGSSDIHIEIYDNKARIRLRIDGALIERYQLNRENYNGLVSVIKLKSGMDIAERRKPQDGRYTHKIGDESFDLRVSVLPTLRGEKVVMRILSNDASDLSLDDVGFKPIQLRHYRENIRKPEGIILISGPTGSGKTTTLYATLKELNEIKRNIMTVEDPVEYTLEGINQVQVKEDIGLTFASALRSFLRQDPDVIMLGEIRDELTAQMAIRAALTGHLVLSTIHTNSAWEITARLIDMGVPDFLVAGTLKLAVAQRLIRRLCVNCKEEITEELEYPSNYIPEASVDKHFRATGCDDCYHTGYKGRIAIYEVIPIDRELSELIRGRKEGVSEKEILKQKEIKLLADNAFEAFRNGDTSFEEVYPILASNF